MARLRTAAHDELLRRGAVVPAHPLALTEERKLDERHQRALTRYYVDSGSGGIAVGVHSTQFEIREHGLYQPVLQLAAETARQQLGESPRPFLLIGGVAGETEQAVKEAQLVRDLGYDAVLLSPPRPEPGHPLAGDPVAIERYALERAREVAKVLPIIGFYLQSAINGPVLSYDFWRQFVEIESVVAVKAAPFNRYRTIDVARAVADSGRDDVTLYTGNDDSIITDLISQYSFGAPDDRSTVVFRGGLLGQWSVWTKRAVEIHEKAQRALSGDLQALADLVGLNSMFTDANAAVFDAANNFKGCIPGTHEVLRRQGLMRGIWCLDPDEGLSKGQSEQLDRVIHDYPELLDDEFVKDNLDRWLA